MNFIKLFETQKILRDRIDYNEIDRNPKLILASLVELGECANEWQGFKFWKKDNKARTKKARGPYMNIEDAEFYNPLLEELVDKLHFILELGLEKDLYVTSVSPNNCGNITRQFILLYDTVIQFYFHPGMKYYKRLFELYVGLSEMLGFTWNEVEQAYFEKNKINHIRQTVGY